MNKTIELIELMKSKEWVSNVELCNKCGWRFWGRICKLKKEWFVFEKKQWEWYIEYWKLTKIPYYEVKWWKRVTMEWMIRNELRKQNKAKPKNWLQRILFTKIW